MRMDGDAGGERWTATPLSSPLPEVLRGTRRRRLMTFTDSIQVCFRKYVEFNGRASRSEFWWWTLFVIVASLLADALLRRLGGVVTLATLLPSIAVTARRLHDINRSGWWQLIGLIPIIGWIVMIFWCVQPPVEPNQYG
jgi:uncharacterized membrane protein YhaH (DUF805 family)